jgi:hypothetical protein
MFSDLLRDLIFIHVPVLVLPLYHSPVPFSVRCRGPLTDSVPILVPVSVPILVPVTVLVRVLVTVSVPVLVPVPDVDL